MHTGLLVRRDLKNPEELQAVFSHAPKGTSLSKLVCVAGSRLATKEYLEQANQENKIRRVRGARLARSISEYHVVRPRPCILASVRAKKEVQTA